MSIDATARAALPRKLLDRERLAAAADGLAIALAVSLPWSTSATSVLAALWLIFAIPSIDREALRRVLSTPAGGLPVLLWGLAVAGLAWSDGTAAERFGALGSFHKLLCIPLLMAQFDRSERAPLLLAAFLGSCSLLLLLSFLLLLFPGFPWRWSATHGIPVKDYLAQGALFSVCAFILAESALQRWQRGDRQLAAGLAILAALFFANVYFVAASRTIFVVMFMMMLLFGYRCAGLRGIAAALVAASTVSAAAWVYSGRMHAKIEGLSTDVRQYRAADESTSSGLRLEFWRKSAAAMLDAPLFGHGTGSIQNQFRKVASEGGGASAVVTANPHNQTLAVGVQLGLAGIAVLFGMWAAHLLLFRDGSTAAWIGTAVVAQNIVGSLFNSQLFDFTHGWFYVIAVGVCGGVMLRRSGP